MPGSPQRRLRLAASRKSLALRRVSARRKSPPPRLMGQQSWTAVRSCRSSTARSSNGQRA
eukprot:5428827-Prorocentrum_lima.AAC.1